jgi:NAD+ synthase
MTATVAADFDPFVTDGDDLERLREALTRFVRASVEGADANGVVVNMSGGIDSTVTATLAVDALGPDRVYGLVLPSNLGAEANTVDAIATADSLGIDYSRVQLLPLMTQFLDRMAPAVDPRNERTALGNVTARLRMTCAYFVANGRSSLVVGTTNRAEALLGYFTKHGDGGADLLPLGDLYKTQVRALARALDVTAHIVEKPSTAGLWTGQTDEDDLGASYATIEAVLHALVDRGWGVERIAAELDVSLSTVERFDRAHRESHHKRPLAVEGFDAVVGG